LKTLFPGDEVVAIVELDWVLAGTRGVVFSTDDLKLGPLVRWDNGRISNVYIHQVKLLER
jgi:hypothetical protein